MLGIRTLEFEIRLYHLVIKLFNLRMLQFFTGKLKRSWYLVTGLG